MDQTESTAIASTPLRAALRRISAVSTGLWPAFALIFAGSLSADAAEPAPPSPFGGSGNAPDLAQVAQNPTSWPAEVTLTNPLSVPVLLNGLYKGQVLLPAGSRLRLIRPLPNAVEVGSPGASMTIAADSTDLLARAGRTQTEPPLAQTPAADRLARAREVTAEIQRDFWNPDTGRYSEKPSEKDPCAAWSFGVMFSALAGASRYDAAECRPIMKKAFTAFDGWWDRKQPLGGYEPFPTNGDGHDKYYDDNEWLVIAFLEAFEITGDRDYSRRAAETMKFVLSGWDDHFLGGGIWWHELAEKKVRAKNTCANAPAAVACLRLARLSPAFEAQNWIAQARKIIDWTVTNLQLPNRLYADTRDIEGSGMNRASLTYNSALMLRAFLGLHRATGNPAFLQKAQQIAVSAGSLIDPKTGVFRDHKKWAHLMVEADLALYRVTKEPYLLQRAQRQADAYYEQWKAKGPEDLINVASVARTLWLLADAETPEGRSFWQKADAATRFP